MVNNPLISIYFQFWLIVFNIGVIPELIPCEKLPVHFTTYEEALNRVKSANFKIKEAANITESSWIKAASYYSCNGKTGFFIFKTVKKEYIHRDMPFDVWIGFKNSQSHGSYYNLFIKGRYQLRLQ